MGISELLAADKLRKEDIAAEKRARAEAKIAEASEMEEKFRKWVPALFNGEYPIKKWVVIEEPLGSYAGGTCVWSLAAVLDGDILFYAYRNSAYLELCCARYKKGSADCWAEMPTKARGCEWRSDANINEANLAKMILQIQDEIEHR